MSANVSIGYCNRWSNWVLSRCVDPRHHSSTEKWWPRPCFIVHSCVMQSSRRLPPSRQECRDEVVFFGGRHGERPEGHRYSKSQVIAFRPGCHCSPESWMGFIDPDCRLDQARQFRVLASRLELDGKSVPGRPADTTCRWQSDIGVGRLTFVLSGLLNLAGR